MAFRMNVARHEDWFLGETKSLRITVWEDKAKTSRANIAGWNFQYDFYEDGVIAFSRTTGDGITIVDAAQGEVAITVPGASTQDLDTRNLHHVFRRTDAGNESVLGVGDVVLNNPAEV